MKTKNISLWMLLLAWVPAFCMGTMAQSATENYVTYSGKVLNSETGDPVVFASIYKIGTNIGTVSNAQGEFVIKVPSALNHGELGSSFIGYKPFAIGVEKINNSYLEIQLQPSPISIKEVVVRSGDPYELLLQARKNIPENYSTAPFMVTAFYREIIKENRRYVGVAEAVLDVYKASYINDFDYDRVKVYKGRKSMDVKRMDTLLFKLQGGPRTSFLLDVVKNPSGLLSDDFMQYYDYTYNGVIEIDKRQTFVIGFDQKDNVPYSLYKGKMYLDAANLSISGLEFSLSEKGIDKAVDNYVKKRPRNLDVEIESANYFVSYREIEGKWYFNNIRSEIEMDCKWDRKLFKSTYVATLEMAVTDMEFENVEKYKHKESAGVSDVLQDQVDYFANTDFWGDYNTIKPDESLESAIDKLNKRVIR
jgi:hypothetical protein